MRESTFKRVLMNRDEAKEMFRKDKDAFGKPRGVMKKIDKIFDEFEIEIEKLKEQINKYKKITNKQI
jgi:hypothetical protein